MRKVVSALESQRDGRRIRLIIARQDLDVAELDFGNLLVEDQNNDAMSYIDRERPHAID